MQEEIMEEEIKNQSWQTNGTPHTILILKIGSIFKVTFSNGYYGDIDEDEFDSLEDAEECFNDFYKTYRSGNGFNF